MLAQSISTFSPGNVWDIQWVIWREIKEVTKANKMAVMGDFTHLYIGKSTGTNRLKKSKFLSDF